MQKITSMGQLEWYRNKIKAQYHEHATIIHVCMTGCRAYGAVAVREALFDEIKRHNLSKQVEIRPTGCLKNRPILTMWKHLPIFR